MKHRKTVLTCLSGAILLYALPAFGADPIISGDVLQAKTNVSMSNMKLTVSGPNGYYVEEFSSINSPLVSLSKGARLDDGVYTWELTGASTKRVKANPMNMDYGRGANQREFIQKSETQSGSFRVLNGVIVTKGLEELEQQTPPKRGFFPHRHDR